MTYVWEDSAQGGFSLGCICRGFMFGGFCAISLPFGGLHQEVYDRRLMCGVFCPLCVGPFVTQGALVQGVMSDADIRSQYMLSNT